MISEKEKKVLRKYLGRNYTKQIIKELEDNKKLNPEGKIFTPSSIRGVLDGQWENLAIEAALWIVAESNKENLKRINENKKSFQEEIVQQSKP